ncbi:prosaposin-like isoform X3, partial [Clarias magur]
GAVQCREQISSHNGLMVKTPKHDLQRGDKQANSVQCTVCTKIVEYIFKSVGKELSKDGIENALRNVCKKIVLHKT